MTSIYSALTHPSTRPLAHSLARTDTIYCFNSPCSFIDSFVHRAVLVACRHSLHRTNCSRPNIQTQIKRKCIIDQNQCLPFWCSMSGKAIASVTGWLVGFEFIMWFASLCLLACPGNMWINDHFSVSACSFVCSFACVDYLEHHLQWSLLLLSNVWSYITHFTRWE